MNQYYISFASPNKFLGSTVVEAKDEEHAIEVATSLGRNPGGDVTILLIPPDIYDAPDLKVYRTKLVGEEEALALGGERLGDMEEGLREIVEEHITRVCAECNNK